MRHDTVLEVPAADDSGGPLGAVSGVRKDDVRDSYAAYALSDGAVVHCQCKDKYQQRATAKHKAVMKASGRYDDHRIQTWFPGTSAAWRPGHPRLPCACSYCGKTIISVLSF